MRYKDLMQAGARISGGIVVLGGILLLILAAVIGESLFGSLWGVEPLAYIGAILLIVGLGALAASYLIPELIARRRGQITVVESVEQRWSRITQRYFEVFDHDLSRPLRRILGKERELRAVIRAAGIADEPGVKDLLDEIERQAPSFRLMISNIRVLVDLEAPETRIRREPVEPSQVVRRIVDRYTSVAAESSKEISWWSEPSEFGIVYYDSSAIEHIVVNLVDNAAAALGGDRGLTSKPGGIIGVAPYHDAMNHVARVTVSDNGPGITEVDRDKLFLPYFSTKGRGSGLGLAIVRRIVIEHGGSIDVTENRPRGTRFSIELPCDTSALDDTPVVAPAEGERA